MRNKKVLRLSVGYAGIVLIAVPAAIFSGMYLVPLLPRFSFIITQNALDFILFRWLLVGIFFLCWPYFVKAKANAQEWKLQKQTYWLKKRLRVTGWVILFEWLICENGLIRFFHWLFS